MKKIFIVLTLVIAMTAGVIIYGKQTNQKTSVSLDESVIRAITNKFPILLKDNKPIIEIADIKQVDTKWYVITIKSINEEEMSVPVKVVLLDYNHPNLDFEIIVNPSTRFVEADMLQRNLPDSVIIELLKS